MANVVKKYELQTIGDRKLLIVGRREGLFAFLLSALGIDPTSTFLIENGCFTYSQASWSGRERMIASLSKVTSIRFGYQRPWKQALVLGACLLPVFGLGLVVGPLYYWLNKSLSLGVCLESGEAFGFDFKRSVIEGVNITEEEGTRMLDMVHAMTIDSGAIRSMAA